MNIKGEVEGTFCWKCFLCLLFFYIHPYAHPFCGFFCLISLKYLTCRGICINIYFRYVTSDKVYCSDLLFHQNRMEGFLDHQAATSSEATTTRLFSAPFFPKIPMAMRSPRPFPKSPRENTRSRRQRCIPASTVS